MTILRLRLVIVLFVLVLFVSGKAYASQREDAIKSGFIYNFARYSQGEWFNAKSTSHYTICSFNTQFINVATQTLQKRSVDKAPVKLQLLDNVNTNITDCNTLYISKEDKERWADLTKSSTSTKMMLVGEFDGFIKEGGHINFFIVGGKVRFEVNPKGLKNSGIKMSSTVLRLGRSYNEEL